MHGRGKRVVTCVFVLTGCFRDSRKMDSWKLKADFPEIEINNTGGHERSWIVRNQLLSVGEMCGGLFEFYTGHV